MIRVVTLDPYDDKHIAKLCRVLYTAFGVGCEHAAQHQVPKGFQDPYDAEKLLAAAPAVRAYADDKVLYLTSKRLKERELPSGKVPTHGFAWYSKDRAIISTAGVRNVEDSMKLIARHALAQLGHLWGLHHCLDPRCSMYPPWTPSFSAGDSVYCAFCREKSERRIREANS